MAPGKTIPKPVKELSEVEAAAEPKRLAAEIAGHHQRYHQEDAPTISDANYNTLRRGLRRRV